MIAFSWGATRFVILIGPFAVKVARIRGFWAVRRFFTHMRNGEVHDKLRKFDANPTRAGCKYLFAGVVSNLREVKLWSATQLAFLTPTPFSFFGLINVQYLGQAVSQEELDREHPFPELLVGLSEEDAFDLARAANFCRFEGRVCLCDYGKEEDFLLLMRVARVRHVVAHAA